MQKKTKVMVFGRKKTVNKNQNIDIMVEGKKIQQVKSFKYLGILLDECLTFNMHINCVIRNTAHKIYLLNRVKQYLTEKSCILIYKSFILPILEYGNVLYIHANSNKQSKLQRMQNNCIKSCLGLDARASTEAIHKLANINLLKDRREKQLLKLMFDRTKNNNYTEKFNSTQIRTRSTTVPKLKVSKFTNNQAKKALSYHGSITWNKLNYELKNTRLKENFVKKLNAIYKEKIKNY